MKLWLAPGPMLSHPDPYRIIPGHALHFRHCNRLFIRRPYLPRCKLWLTYSQHTRKRRIILFHLYLPSHCTWTLLRLPPIQRNLKHRRSPSAPGYRHGLRWLCPTMRANVLLRGNGHYQPNICRPLRRRYPCSVSLRRLFRRQRHPHPLFRLPLSAPVHCSSHHSHPPLIPSPDRLEQPCRP